MATLSEDEIGRIKAESAGVYSITSRLTGKVYVGSSVNVVLRWRHHRSRLRTGHHTNSHLQAHARKYGVDDLVFEMMEAEPDYSLRLGLEQLMVTALYGRQCFNQAQDVSAPTRGRSPTLESRAKQSAALKGRTRSPEHRANLQASMIGRIVTPEARAKMSESACGRKLSPETRAKIGAAHSGRPQPPVSEATRTKLSAAAAGRTRGPRSPETKAKISAAHKGRVHSAESRANMSAAHIGKRHADTVTPSTITEVDGTAQVARSKP